VQGDGLVTVQRPPVSIDLAGDRLTAPTVLAQLGTTQDALRGELDQLSMWHSLL
jgi:hypothetical protein